MQTDGRLAAAELGGDGLRPSGGALAASRRGGAAEEGEEGEEGEEEEEARQQAGKESKGTRRSGLTGQTEVPIAEPPTTTPSAPG